MSKVNRFKQVSLALLLAGGLGLGAQAASQDTSLSQNSFQIAANETLTGRPDLDSHPGPGDTDINNDGKNDLQQIEKEAGQWGNVLQRETEKFENRAQTELNRAGDRAQAVAQDLDDADVTRSPIMTWLVIALIVLALAAIVFAATRRRRRTVYR